MAILSRPGRSPKPLCREMAGVVRRGGRVVAQDFETNQTVVDASDQSLASRVVEAPDVATPNPWIDPQLFASFGRTGLIDVRVVPHAIVLIGGEDGAELPTREADVLALLAEGLTNTQIAGRLYLSPRTVEKHV